MRKLGGQEPQTPSQVAATQGMICGIMGLPFAGKTSLADTLLDDEITYPVCVIQVGGGAHVLKDVPDKLVVYTPRDWHHLTQMIRDLVNDPAPFKSVWLDTMTYIVEDNMEIHDVKDKEPGRERQIAYGDANFDIVKLHRDLITDLAANTGVNVFIVYHATRPEVREKSGDANPTLPTQHIALSNTLSLKITGLLDILVFIEAKDGPNPYPPRMRLHGSLKYETRLRFRPDHPIKKLPAVVENPSLPALVRAFRGELIE